MRIFLLCNKAMSEQCLIRHSPGMACDVIVSMSCKLGNQDVYVSPARDVETILVAEETEVRTSRPTNHSRVRSAIFRARMQAGRVPAFAKLRLSETIHYTTLPCGRRTSPVLRKRNHSLVYTCTCLREASFTCFLRAKNLLASLRWTNQLLPIPALVVTQSC